ncbi:MAG: hypothetical protein C5B47_01240 [Verrucomicrobia bacterium]|nr:MAG: hypothetical protein C5B47_01240 [Verrucomicrobiota bacterium]
MKVSSHHIVSPTLTNPQNCSGTAQRTPPSTSGKIADPTLKEAAEQKNSLQTALRTRFLRSVNQRDSVWKPPGKWVMADNWEWSAHWEPIQLIDPSAASPGQLDSPTLRPITNYPAPPIGDVPHIRMSAAPINSIRLDIINKDTSVFKLLGENITSLFPPKLNFIISGTTILENDPSRTGQTTVGIIDILDGGHLTIKGRLVSTKVYIHNGGTLTIANHIAGKVENFGTFHPEMPIHSAAAPSIGGDYVQSSSAKMLLQFRNADSTSSNPNIVSDRIAITEEAQLDGKLELQFDDGVGPRSGEEFTIFTAANGISGRFSSVDSQGGPVQLIYSNSDVKVRFT